MQSTRFRHPMRGRPRIRVFAHRAALAALGALTVAGLGCSEPRPTGAPPEGRAIIIIGGQPGVLNAQLREINGFSWQLPVVGHLQFRISQESLLDQNAVLEWKGMILNADCVTFGGGGIYYLPAIQNPEWPTSEDRAVVEIPRGTRTDCGDIPVQLEGSTVISLELATRMVQDPENFVVAFFGDGGGLIAGTLKIGNPDEAPTR